MNRFILYFRTLRHLRLLQIIYLVIRKLGPASRFRGSRESFLLRANIGMIPGIPQFMLSKEENEFIFLNVAHDIGNKGIDWSCSHMSRLWRYNLHYFDYLLEQDRSPENISRLLSDWMTHNPIGQGEGWEPYTISLRIVNWTKRFLQPGFTDEIQKVWLESLFQQTLWLEKNLEYHILANHFLKNGKALFFSGMFFDGTAAERWRRKGLEILLKEAEEQILSDGGHYERSLMYHAIVVEDYLDVLNLLIHSDHATAPRRLARLKLKTIQALTFLDDLCYPDGEISLFNDAAFGIAPTPADLFEYGQRLLGYEKKKQSNMFFCDAKESSGYYLMRQKDDLMVVDCGPVGPSYQPGHAHCDLLSYELVLEGLRIIVDSGVYDYESGEMRQSIRSTRAHNTIMVDGIEQSEIWDTFRVARRARPIAGLLEGTGKNSGRFIGSHDGYKRLSGNVVHERVIDYDETKGWAIIDRLHGFGRHLIEDFIHIHPDFKCHLKGRSICLKDKNRQTVATILVPGAVDISIETGWYCPEFGLKFENDVIRLYTRTELPFKMSYQIYKN